MATDVKCHKFNRLLNNKIINKKLDSQDKVQANSKDTLPFTMYCSSNVDRITSQGIIEYKRYSLHLITKIPCPSKLHTNYFTIHQGQINYFLQVTT